jgi:hypothetical protein
MPSVAPITVSQTLPREPFDHARHAVNAWRGRCMDAFARAEAAVTEMLLILSGVEHRGAEVKLQHLVGQRFEGLAIALGAGGAFAAEGKAASAALGAFRVNEELRVLLCHGVGSITLDVQGRWTIVLRVLSLRGRKPARELRVFEEAEAAALASELCAASQKLCSQLGNLRARLVAG